MSAPISEPFVGPRPFTDKEFALFRGRNREIADLLSLILRNRLVLFYAASGVGKTSLINTALVPELVRRGFHLLGVVRVSGDLSPDVADVENIAIFNLILSLDDQRHPPATFSRATLTEYLQGHGLIPEVDATKRGSPHLLVIDQFEELFTAHPERWRERAGFFTQLHDALDQLPLLWVLLVMRAEYLASLDRFAPLVPGQLSTRFSMQGLDARSAVQAIEGPTAAVGRPFEEGVARRLVENLSHVRIRDQDEQFKPGEFVEPVQLQVVCQQLWDAIKADPQQASAWRMFSGSPVNRGWRSLSITPSACFMTM